MVAERGFVEKFLHGIRTKVIIAVNSLLRRIRSLMFGVAGANWIHKTRHCATNFSSKKSKKGSEGEALAS